MRTGGNYLVQHRIGNPNYAYYSKGDAKSDDRDGRSGTQEPANGGDGEGRDQEQERELEVSMRQPGDQGLGEDLLDRRDQPQQRGRDGQDRARPPRLGQGDSA